MIKTDFWKKRRVFVTGHTGFKGCWLALTLVSFGAKVKGYALEPNTKNSLFRLTSADRHVESSIEDINDLEKLKSNIAKFEPDVVFHLAAQPLVGRSYEDPHETFKTNVLGTVNLFEAARCCKSVKVIINITTDKVYKNQNWLWHYREIDQLGGHDPYSSSKVCSEFVAESYYNSFLSELGVGVACARAGNVIGGGDWSKNRLIPDILGAFGNNQVAQIRNPLSVRPWQHVLEPIAGYMELAQNVFLDPCRYSGAWNFGPNSDDDKTVQQVADKMKDLWPGNSTALSPEKKGFHETAILKLDSVKAKTLIGWRPTLSVDEALEKTILWYKAWLQGQEMYQVTTSQIFEYFSTNKGK